MKRNQSITKKKKFKSKLNFFYIIFGVENKNKIFYNSNNKNSNINGKIKSI